VPKGTEILRAHFSALTMQDIGNAMDNLQKPNKNLSDAVNVRQEMDLRIGASFTRWQTLRFRHVFGSMTNIVLSYGPCQFPTLGFLVERQKLIDSHKSEAFWFLKLKIQKIEFNWARGKIMEKENCENYFENCNKKEAFVS
jgi:DNA topoisomerase-3